MSPASRRALTLVLPIVVLASPALAQKKGKKTFAETTSVVAVEVPVTVTRDGEPVADLTAENFELFDGRNRQEITGFQVIDLSKAETRDPLEHRIPVAARRHFLLVFDMAFSQPDSILRARDAALEVIGDLHPTDLAGVLVYNSTTGANLVLNFTSDRNQLRLAIETLGVPEMVERASDPLGIVFGDVQSFTQQAVLGGADTGGRGEDARRERVLEAVGRIFAAEKTAQLNKVSALTGNMEALARQMAAIEGRKHLVYFSEGIPSEVVADEDIRSGFDGVIDAATTSDPNASFSTTETSAIGQSSRAQNELESMIEAFRRAGCVVQAVDIGGARALNEIGGRASGEDSLVAMSKDTGGEFFRNFNDLGVAMDKMLARNSVTYLLVFQPEDLRLDGDYHRLRVKLKDVPRGTRASHRSGYYAPTSFEETSNTQRRLEAAELIMGGEDGGDLEAALLAAAFPVPSEKAYVPLILELDGASLLEGGDRGTLPLELYAYATDENGSVYDFFTQQIGLELTQNAAGLRDSGVKYWGHFDLPPGTYSARVLVRDLRDGRYAMRQAPVVVPAFEEAEATLLPPLFPEPPTKWLLVREVEARQRQVDYPFMLGGQPFIPAVAPAVPAKGSTPFYFRSLNLPGEVDFTGEVVTSAGDPVKKARLKIEPATAGDGALTAVAELETQGLTPGEYVLVGTATSEAGEQRSSSLRFVVR